MVMAEAHFVRGASAPIAAKAAPTIRLLALALFFLAACGDRPPATSQPSGSAEPLYFANWAGEIGTDTLAEFERRTGIRVVVDEIVDNVTLQTKLLAGNSGSDVVVPSSNFVQPLIAAGALRTLDRRLLPNWRHLDPAILGALERIDPGNQHGVPYVWGTQAFGYNPQAAARALGREPEPTWRLLFDPENARRLSDCGIAWGDSAGSIMVDLALLAIGRDPGIENAADLAAAEAALIRVRPYVRYIDSSLRARSELASGEICLAIGANGEIIQSRDMAAAAGNGVDVRYVVPEEGALMWVDLLAIPADAPHVEAAHRFIDFLMEPAIIAGVSNAAKYANANRDADGLVDPAVRRDPAIYPPPEVMSRLQLVPAESPAYTRERTRMWTRVRTMTE
jgi:putrescine transport system substrate-binding protein